MTSSGSSAVVSIDEHVARSNIAGAIRPLHRHDGVERQGHGGQVSGGVAVGQRAADSATVAYLDVADLLAAFGKHAARRTHIGGFCDGAVGCERAKLHIAIDGDASQAFDLIDVDQDAGLS